MIRFLFYLALIGIACHRTALPARDVYDYGVYLNTSRSFYSERQLDSAYLYINKAIHENPGADSAYFYRAIIREKQNDMKGCLEDFNKAISLHPKPVYFNNRGMLKSIMEDFPGALIDYDQAIALDSLYGLAWFNKGITYHYQEKYDSACAYIQKALVLGMQDAESYLKEYCKP